MLWFLGTRRAAPHSSIRRPLGCRRLVWIGAASLSIAINGARDLRSSSCRRHRRSPGPPVWIRRTVERSAACGSSRSPSWCSASGASASSARVRRLQVRGLPPLIENIRFDLDYALGRIERSLLARFSGGKFDAVATDEMIRYVAETTAVRRRICVGFSGGSIGAWSTGEPDTILLEPPGHARIRSRTSGLRRHGPRADLKRDPPALVILRSSIGISAKRCRTRRSSS